MTNPFQSPGPAQGRTPQGAAPAAYAGLGPPPDEVEIMDFSYQPPAIKFSADGEVYECHPVISIPAMQDLVKTVRAGGLDTTSDDAIQQSMQKLARMFDIILIPDSAQRFNARLLSADQPFDMFRQIIPILHHVLERYGLRPTQQSSSSSPGSPVVTAGTGSTAGESSTA